MRHDSYDVRIVFDDLYEQSPPIVYPTVVGAADTKRAVRSVLRKVGNERVVVPLTVEPTTTDTTVESFRVDDNKYEILGDLSATADRFPIYTAILRCFQSVRPAPKLVRVDTPDSYAQFREARRASRCADLDGRLRALELLLAQHIADGHSGGRLASLEDAFERHLEQHPDGFQFGDYSERDVLGEEVLRTARQCLRGGNPIPVVKKLRGKVECWQDGDEICCTVRFLNRRGNLTMATTGTPAQHHLEELLNCVSPEEFEHTIPVMDRLVQILGSTALIPELCRVVPILSTTDATSPMMGVMVAQGTPVVAAAMALVQQCQQGNRRAHADFRSMRKCGADPLLAEAIRRLARAQYAKKKMLVG